MQALNPAGRHSERIGANEGQLGRWARGVVLAAFASTAGCVPANPTYIPSLPKVQSSGEYDKKVLKENSVLMLPLAVEGELGDERSGVVISSQTQTQASKQACEQLKTELRRSTEVICASRSLGPQQLKRAQRRILKQFALDKPIDIEALKTVRKHSTARFLLLFRPEDVAVTVGGQEVNSPQDVARIQRRARAQAELGSARQRDLDNAALDAAKSSGASAAEALLISGLAGLIFAAAESGPAATGTLRTYTLSGVMVDLRTGQAVRLGAHTGGALKTTNSQKNLGYVESVNATPILAELMEQLGARLLVGRRSSRLQRRRESRRSTR